MEKFKSELINFIENSTCSYTCCSLIKDILNKNDFIELEENDKWNLEKGKYYVTRNNTSIIAFIVPDNYNKYFSIITSHLDTPSLELKVDCCYTKENYLKLNVMPYGGLLNYGWLDHPLSLAGRIVRKKNNKLDTEIVDFKKPIAIIPSVAIHQNSKANTNLDLNSQIDMQPIFSIGDNIDLFNKLVDKNVISYDLFLYNLEKPGIMGVNHELLVSPRIDNITSVYTSLNSFIDSIGSSIKVFCSFNNEEIGSLTLEGADSNFLIDTLKRITASFDIDLVSTLSKSIIISSDNTHAVHPNHNELSDDTAKLYLNKGFVIVKEANTTTDSITEAIIKELCDKNNIKYQIGSSRNDLSSGSTLSGISLRHASVKSIDVGVSELAMHSSIEVCSINDISELYKMMKAFYDATIIIDKDSIKVQ